MNTTADQMSTAAAAQDPNQTKKKMNSTDDSTQKATQEQQEQPPKCSTRSKQLSLFAKKPKAANHNKPMQLVSNYQRIHTASTKPIVKYSASIEPSISDNGKLFGQIIKGSREQLGKSFKFFVDFAKHVYAYEMISDDIVTKAEVDGTEYTMTIKFAKTLDKTDPELMTFYSIFFKKMMRMLTFEQVGRNCFLPKKAVSVNQAIEIWPGFYSALNRDLEAGMLLQLDLASRVVRVGDNVLPYLQDLLRKYDNDRERVNEEVKGMPIVTSYAKGGKHTYRVDCVDFEKNIDDEFETKDGKISFRNYYQKNYNINIRESDQPLLKVLDRKTDREMYFVPEICQMTGLTDQQRADFRLMKDMAQHLHKPPGKRIQEAEALITEMENQVKVKKLMEEWQVKIEKKAFEVEGQHISAGNILMAKNVQPFKGDGDPRDFDRKIQDKMRTEVGLKQWCIIHSERTKKEANIFQQTIGQCIDQFKYDAQRPMTFCIRGRDNDWNAWETVMKEKLNPKVSMVVFILSGPKKKGACYEQIKQKIYQQMPVPSQCILASTLNGKNLRSICNKILIQINAKMGGVPWSISDMPYTNLPTSVIGYSSVKKKGNQHVFGLCATWDREYSRYFCSSHLQSDEIATGLRVMFKEAFDAFKRKNKIFPKQLIVYRDGVSDSQKAAMFEMEVEQIRQAIAENDDMKDKCKLLFCTVNKKIKTKYVLKERNMAQVPPAGTIVDRGIVDKDLYDFFLVSTVCRQGVPTPSHYSVLVDEIGGKGPEDIQKLTYKLCYLYYNTSGPIKIPCPVKYAFLLATRVAEQKSLMNTKPGEMLIHKHYISNMACLFHI